MDYQTQPPKHGSCVRRKEKLLLCKTLLSIDLGFAECAAGRCSAEIHPGSHRPAVFFVFFPPSHTAGAVRRARPVAAVPLPEQPAFTPSPKSRLHGKPCQTALPHPLSGPRRTSKTSEVDKLYMHNMN